jgi:hypothetical protein
MRNNRIMCCNSTNESKREMGHCASWIVTITSSRPLCPTTRAAPPDHCLYK